MKRLFPNDRVFLRRCFIVGGLGVGALLVIWFIAAAIYGLMLVFFAVLLAVALDGLARLVRSVVGMSRHVAVMVSAATIAILLGTGLTLGGIDVAAQAPQLQKQIAQSLDNISTELRNSGITGRLVGKSTGSGASSAASAAGPGEEIIGELSNVLTVTVSTLADMLIVAIIGLYLALEPYLYRNGLLRLFPARQQPRVIDLCMGVIDALRRWLIGRGIAMLAIGVTSILGLWLIGVPFALLLGLFAGLLTFVPYLGPIVSAVPAVLVASLHGLSTAVYVVLLYLALHILEGYVLMPLVQKRVVSLAPGFLLIAQVLGGAVAGVMGITLAAPVALVIAVIVQLGYVRDVMGDLPHLPGQWDISKEDTDWHDSES